MKRLAILLLMIAPFYSCNKLRDYFPLPQTPQFNKTYGGTQSEGARSIVKTTDGGYVFTGSSESNDGDVSGNHGVTDAWVVKLDKAGNKLWQKMLGGSSVDHGVALARTLDGGFILAAITTSSDGDVTGYHGGAGEDAWIVKLDNNGTIQWQKTLGGTVSDVPSAIIATPDGNYVMAGYTESNDGDVNNGNRTSYDAWVVKLDGEGDLVWQQTLGGSDPDYAYAIVPTLDGGYVMAGNLQSKDANVPGYHSRGDAWMVKLASDGTVAWQKAVGGWNYDVAFSVVAPLDGSYVLAGSSTSPNGDVKGNHGNSDAWVVKLDGTGKLLWAKAFGGTSFDHALSLTTTADGGYAFAGYTYSNDGDVSGTHGKEHADAWMVKLNANGSKQWQKAVGGSEEDIANAVITRVDGGFAIAGGSLSNDGDVTGNKGQSDAWIFTLKDQ
jgi:hypothetical protein